MFSIESTRLRSKSMHCHFYLSLSKSTECFRGKSNVTEMSNLGKNGFPFKIVVSTRDSRQTNGGKNAIIQDL